MNELTTSEVLAMVRHHVKDLDELIAIAESGVAGKFGALNDGYGVREHEIALRSYRDAKHIFQCLIHSINQ